VKVLEILPEDDFFQMFIQCYEELTKKVFYSASAHSQKQICHSLTILDMTNFSMTKCNKTVHAFIKKTSVIQ